MVAELCDVSQNLPKSWLKIEKDKEGVLGEKFQFKKLPDGSEMAKQNALPQN